MPYYLLWHSRFFRPHLSVKPCLYMILTKVRMRLYQRFERL